MSDQRIDITRGSADQPDATIDADPGTFFAVLSDGRSIADVQRGGEMTIEGDIDVVENLMRLFPRPAAAR